MSNELFQQGLAIRKAVLGNEYVEKSLASADDFSRPMQELATEYCWGRIWSRPGLSLRERELIVMSVLVATGSDGVSHLMQHADAVGITDAQIKELILQTIPYSGQPKAIQAMLTLKRVQAAREPKP